MLSLLLGLLPLTPIHGFIQILWMQFLCSLVGSTNGIIAIASEKDRLKELAIMIERGTFEWAIYTYARFCYGL